MNADDTGSAGTKPENIQTQETSSGEASIKTSEMHAGNDNSAKAAESRPADEKILRLEGMIGDLSSMISRIAASVERFSADHSRILEEISELKRRVAPRSETKVVEAEDMKKESMFKGKGFSEKDIAIDKIFYSGQK